MAVMVTEVYDALKEAGASDDKSKKAAEAVAAYGDRFAKIELEIAGMRADLVAMKWMQGITIGGVVALLIKSFV